MSLESLRNKLLLSLVFGLLVFFGLTVYADFGKIILAIGHFEWKYTPAILGFTFFNYCLRFVKWDYYLRQVGVRGLSKADSFLAFFSGLSMVVTPGKLGEWVKCYLVKECTATPFSRTAPIVIAERVTDGLAMVVLALGGLLLFQTGWQVFLAMIVASAIAVAVVRYRPFALRLIALLEKVPLISKKMHQVMQFYESSHTLFSFKNLAFAVGLGVVSWFGECLALYFVFLGLGIESSWMLIIQSSFIMASSTLAGALLLLPGGLGAAEGGITGLSQLLLGMPKDLAATAALLIRVATLWFGVAVGALMLALAVNRLKTRGAGATVEPTIDPSVYN